MLTSKKNKTFTAFCIKCGAPVDKELVKLTIDVNNPSKRKCPHCHRILKVPFDLRYEVGK